MRHKRAIFWFKRDLRTEDNTGLYQAVNNSNEVIPLYILDEDILKHYAEGSKRLSFFYNALHNLDSQLREMGSRLLVIKGRAEEIFPDLLKRYEADAVYCNRANGFYGVKRDHNVQQICKSLEIEFYKCQDTFLVPPSDVDQRKVFTPFFKLWEKKRKGKESPALATIDTPVVPDMKPLEDHVGGVREDMASMWPVDFAEKRLQEFDFDSYEETRNLPYIDGTSRLSPYLRFGVVSVRRVYNAAMRNSPEANTYVSELAWREFWYHIMHYFPETRHMEFQEKRRNMKWINNERWFIAWTKGLTGYPIVDAGMRQLLEEGWIHNRVRMIVASFLTKDLLCDWRWGDRHFSEHLIDYDEAVDIGNWQWVASCGADPKPLRIFNPLLQSEKFDPECEYIRKYIPELADVPVERIHNPLTYKLPYCEPIVNHYEMRNLAQEMYSGRRLDDKYLSDIKNEQVFSN